VNLEVIKATGALGYGYGVFNIQIHGFSIPVPEASVFIYVEPVGGAIPYHSAFFGFDYALLAIHAFWPVFSEIAPNKGLTVRFAENALDGGSGPAPPT